jgi:RNA polymerase sigma-70 factor (ECF subfamily)
MARGTNHVTDEELVKEILADNPDRYRALVERYQQQLYRYVLKYIYDDAKAQDIVQEAFIKMYMNLRSFDTTRVFSAWAFRITHNEMLNFIKKHKRELDIDDNTWLPNLADDRPSISEELDRKIKKRQLHDALKLLPMKYREILILYYYQGCNYEAIAEILIIPVSTVSTRISRAKVKLKKVLLKEYGNV